MKKILAILFSVLTLVVACTAMAVPAMAATYSPEGEVVHKITVVSYATGEPVAGTYKTEGDTVILTAAEDSKYEFVKWDIEPNDKYEIISGSLTSKKLVIRPLADLHVKEVYSTETSQGTSSVPESDKTDAEQNDSDKAPETGNAALGFVLLVIGSGFAAMMVAKKRMAA